MKFSTAIVTAYIAALASATEFGIFEKQYPNYFELGPTYLEPSYNEAYGEALPGPDFNKQVYEFNEYQPIWDQDDYVSRVNVEAEILVALESLKDSVRFINDDLVNLHEGIEIQLNRILENCDDIYQDVVTLVQH